MVVSLVSTRAAVSLASVAFFFWAGELLASSDFTKYVQLTAIVYIVSNVARLGSVQRMATVYFGDLSKFKNNVKSVSIRTLLLCIVSSAVIGAFFDFSMYELLLVVIISCSLIYQDALRYIGGFNTNSNIFLSLRITPLPFIIPDPEKSELGPL